MSLQASWIGIRRSFCFSSTKDTVAARMVFRVTPPAVASVASTLTETGPVARPSSWIVSVPGMSSTVSSVFLLASALSATW